MDVFGTAISMGLQYGVPLEVFVNKFSHMRFEPTGSHQEPRHPHRQEHRRLHLPLAGHGVHPRLPRGPDAALNEKPQVPTEEDSDPQHRPAAMKAGGPNAATDRCHGKARSARRVSAQGSGVRGQGRAQDTNPKRKRGITETPLPLGEGTAAGADKGSAANSQRHQPLGHAQRSNGNGHPPAAKKPDAAEAILRAARHGQAARAAPARRPQRPVRPLPTRRPQLRQLRRHHRQNGNCYLCHNCGNSMGCS